MESLSSLFTSHELTYNNSNLFQKKKKISLNVIGQSYYLWNYKAFYTYESPYLLLQMLVGVT